jgi:hypothetical protein
MAAPPPTISTPASIVLENRFMKTSVNRGHLPGSCLTVAMHCTGTVLPNVRRVNQDDVRVGVFFRNNPGFRTARPADRNAWSSLRANGWV